MQTMPSLFKSLTHIGCVLVILLISLHGVIEPGGPGPRLVAAKKRAPMRYDPHASLVERDREEAAQQVVTAARGRTGLVAAQAGLRNLPATVIPPVVPAVIDVQ